jgi:hypothetical protein
MEALLVIVGGAALITLLLVYSSFASGFVLYKFYYWFLLPIVPSLPHFSLIECIGIMLFLVAVKSGNGNDDFKDEVKKSSSEMLASALVKPWMILGMGWLLKVVMF